MEDFFSEKELKAFIEKENPAYKRKDKKNVEIEGESKNIIIKNIYSRRLEDLTFSDLRMIGYTNPNTFVKEWEIENGKFDINKKVWIVVYEELE